MYITLVPRSDSYTSVVQVRKRFQHITTPKLWGRRKVFLPDLPTSAYVSHSAEPLPGYTTLAFQYSDATPRNVMSLRLAADHEFHRVETLEPIQIITNNVNLEETFLCDMVQESEHKLLSYLHFKKLTTNECGYLRYYYRGYRCADRGVVFIKNVDLPEGLPIYNSNTPQYQGRAFIKAVIAAARKYNMG